MIMNSITFSHIYDKMPMYAIMLAEKTKLLHVFVEDVSTVGKDFREYDTKIKGITNFYYPLPHKGKFLFLLLKTNGTLWTTIRRWTPRKEAYYVSCVGQDFKIVINDQGHKTKWSGGRSRRSY